jgi:hypothetical protein
MPRTKCDAAQRARYDQRNGTVKTRSEDAWTSQKIAPVSEING